MEKRERGKKGQVFFSCHGSANYNPFLFFVCRTATKCQAKKKLFSHLLDLIALSLSAALSFVRYIVSLFMCAHLHLNVGFSTSYFYDRYRCNEHQIQLQYSKTLYETKDMYGPFITCESCCCFVSSFISRCFLRVSVFFLLLCGFVGRKTPTTINR